MAATALGRTRLCDHTKLCTSGLPRKRMRVRQAPARSLPAPRLSVPWSSLVAAVDFKRHHRCHGVAVGNVFLSSFVGRIEQLNLLCRRSDRRLERRSRRPSVPRVVRRQDRSSPDDRRRQRSRVSASRPHSIRRLDPCSGSDTPRSFGRAALFRPGKLLAMCSTYASYAAASADANTTQILWRPTALFIQPHCVHLECHVHIVSKNNPGASLATNAWREPQARGAPCGNIPFLATHGSIPFLATHSQGLALARRVPSWRCGRRTLRWKRSASRQSATLIRGRPASPMGVAWVTVFWGCAINEWCGLEDAFDRRGGCRVGSRARRLRLQPGDQLSGVRAVSQQTARRASWAYRCGLGDGGYCRGAA